MHIVWIDSHTVSHIAVDWWGRLYDWVSFYVGTKARIRCHVNRNRFLRDSFGFDMFAWTVSPRLRCMPRMMTSSCMRCAMSGSSWVSDKHEHANELVEEYSCQSEQEKNRYHMKGQVPRNAG